MDQPRKSSISYEAVDALFPGRRMLRRFEGGAVYEAETDEDFVLITSEGTLADYLDDEDLPLVSAATLYSFNSAADRAAYASGRGWNRR